LPGKLLPREKGREKIYEGEKKNGKHNYFLFEKKNFASPEVWNEKRKKKEKDSKMIRRKGVQSRIRNHFSAGLKGKEKFFCEAIKRRKTGKWPPRFGILVRSLRHRKSKKRGGERERPHVRIAKHP